MIKNRNRRKQKDCPNCGTQLPVEANFCQNCGQENHHQRVTLGTLLKDLVHENFTWDAKAIRSIVPLIIKPGLLTLEFMNGKRANYNRPLRLYLFVSFVYFVVSGFVGDQTDSDVEVEAVENADEFIKVNFAEGESDSIELATIHQDSSGWKGNEFLKTNFPEATASIETREGLLRFQEALLNSLPMFFFAIIPAFGFWMFLLFYRRGSYYVDSFVFSLHGQTAIFIGVLIVIIVQMIFPREIFSFIMFFLLFYYFAVAAKRVYKVSLFGSIIRLVAVLILHGITTVCVLLLYLVYLLITFV